MPEDRNTLLDFLRFLGLVMIIFAHVDPPHILFQLRNFDVPLMIIVSAMSYSLAYKPEQSYRQYILSRLKRLALPVWIFLSGYFILLFLLNPLSDQLATKKIIESYLFLDGIGYVWIIRVFLLVALASPLIYKHHLNTVSNTRYLTTVLGVYLLYELALYLRPIELETGGWKYLFEILFYIIPYSLLFALGLRISKLNFKQHIFISLASLLIFITLAAALYFQNGYIVPTQHFKYPPSAYYLSFALFGIWSVYLCAPIVWKRLQSFKPIESTVLFIGRNSLWIYLWHIPLVEHLNAHFILKYTIVLIASTLITFIQIYIVRNVILPKIKKPQFQKNIKAVFTG